MRTSRNIAVATRVAALLVFAVGVLPRSTTYVHDHADSGRAHVHAWDGTRTDDIRQLIDDARGDTHEHPHVHPHEHGAELAHAHGEPARTIAPARRTDRRRQGPAIAPASSSATEHTHTQAPFQTFGTRAALLLPVRVSAPIAAPAATTRPVARALPALRARAPPLPAQA